MFSGCMTWNWRPSAAWMENGANGRASRMRLSCSTVMPTIPFRAFAGGLRRRVRPWRPDSPQPPQWYLLASNKRSGRVLKKCPETRAGQSECVDRRQSGSETAGKVPLGALPGFCRSSCFAYSISPCVAIGTSHPASPFGRRPFRSARRRDCPIRSRSHRSF